MVILMLTRTFLLAPIVWLVAVFAFADHYGSGREIPVPFPAETSPAVRHMSSDVACGTEQCLVAWTAWNDANRSGYEIRGARISKSGVLLDGTSFTIASVSSHNVTPAQVIALESDYVVFYSGISYARVARNGAVTVRDARTSFSSEMGSVNEAVAAGGAILLYSVENRGPLVPYVTVLDEKLNVIREVKIDGQPTDIASTGAGFVVASTSVEGLKVTRLSSDGTIVNATAIPEWNAAGAIAATGDSVLVAWRRPVTNDGPATVEFATVTSDGVQRTVVLDQSISSASSLDVASTASGYLVLWSRATSGYYTDHAFAARISSTGEVQDPKPIAITTKSEFQIHVKGAATEAGYVSIWSDWRFGSGHDHVFAAVVPVSGPAGDDFLVSRLFVSQSHVVLATARSTVGLAWREAAGDGAGAVMFTRAHRNGTLFATEPIRFSDVGGPPALTTNGDLYVVAWREWGLVRFAMVTEEGRITASSSIGAAGFGGISVAAAEGDFVLVFDDNGEILTARVRYDGTVIDVSPRRIAFGTDPVIGFNGQGYWIAYRSGGKVEARRLSAEGTLIDTVPFAVAGAVDETHEQLAIACGEGTCAALWRSFRAGESTIEGALLVSGAAVPLVIAPRASDAAEPALAWNGDGYEMTWSERETPDANRNIHAARLAASGNVVGNSMLIADSESDERFPAVSGAHAERIFAFSRASSEGGARLFLRFEDDAPRRRSVRR